ncbi:DUF721 domain-containing protein [bacterium]|nr:DUF721 domain-containing protein [bacterium]
MSFIDLKNLLPQSLARNKIKPQIEATNVLVESQKIIEQVWGKEVGRLVEPKYVKEKNLHIRCSSATAANALGLAKKKLIEEINKACQEELIKDIVFWQ